MRVLRHAYVREGDPRPKTADGAWLPQSMVLHVAGRSDDTGLDIWWWEDARG